MKTSAWLPLAAFVLGLTGCTAQQQQAATHGFRVTTVMGKLVAVDVDAATNVHVSSRNGVVTLKGQARNARERARYAAAAKSVSGVTAVRNDLVVNPRLQGVREQAGDAGLIVKVDAAIAAHAGANVFHVTPAVRGGVVTLTGTVPSRSVDRTIVTSVRAVAGVKRVVDRITP